MKTLSTVNVIHLHMGNLQTLTAFNDNPEGNQAAEEHFKSLIEKNLIEYSLDDMENFIENGQYTDGAGTEILLVHSETTDTKKGFTPSTLEWEDIVIGQYYNVHKKDDADMFTHGFVGSVIDKNATHIIVEDQDGDTFTVDPDQLTPNTDEIMHGK
jgi:hypothetical protein